MAQHEQTLASFQVGKIPDYRNGYIQYLYLDSGSEGYVFENGNSKFDFILKYVLL
jgi:hypothetical protein